MKKIKFISDPYTFFFGIAYLIIFEACGAIFFIEEAAIKMGIFSMVAVLLTFLFCLPKWITIVEMNENGVLLYVPFKRTIKKTYKEYNHLQIGWYFQGKNSGLGYYRYFIVISENGFSQEELSRVNLIQNSESAMKIKFTKKRYEILSEILPNFLKIELEKAIEQTLKEAEETGDGS